MAKHQQKLFLFICFALVFLIYGHTLGGDFVFDDRSLVQNRELLSDINNLPQIVSMGYWGNQETGLYRPVVLLSYSLNYIFFGPSANSFHLINLILYALVGYFLFRLIKKLFPKPKYLAEATALLFLVLPIHSEVAANIIGRAEILSLLFSLLVFLELAKPRVNHWKVGLWFLLAIGSKETAIAALPIALLILFFKHRAKLNRKNLVDSAPCLILLFLSAAVYFAFRLLVLGPYFITTNASLVENPLAFASPFSRIATGLKILVLYLQKSFWPLNLCSDYSYDQIPVEASFFNFQVLLGLGLLLLFVFCLIYFLGRRPPLSLAAGFFLFAYLPVSNLFFPIGAIAGERLMFYPSVGLALFASYFLIKLSQLKARKLFFYSALGLFILIMVFYASLSFIRAIDWLNEKNLFLSAAECAPQSVLSRSNLAALYYLEGDYQRALEENLAAKQIYPNYSKGINNLGLTYWKLGQPEKARQEYYRAIKNWPPYSGVYENLILLEISQNNFAKAKKWIRIIFSPDRTAQKAMLEKFGLE